MSTGSNQYIALLTSSTAEFCVYSCPSVKYQNPAITGFHNKSHTGKCLYAHPVWAGLLSMGWQASLNCRQQQRSSKTLRAGISQNPKDQTRRTKRGNLLPLLNLPQTVCVCFQVTASSLVQISCRMLPIGHTTGLGWVRQPHTAPAPINTTPTLSTGPTQPARTMGPGQTCRDLGCWTPHKSQTRVNWRVCHPHKLFWMCK